MNRLLFVLPQLLFTSLLGASSLSAGEYTEDKYLQDVISVSKELQANTVEIDAARLDEAQVDRQLAPVLQSTLAVNQDRRQQQFSSPSYESANSLMFDASYRQQLSQGTQIKLGVEARQTQLTGINVGPNVPRVDAKLATLSPSIEVSQALWQNAWGRSLDWQRSILQSSTQIREKQKSALELARKLEARLAYGRLAFARERRDKAEISLANAEKILRYLNNQAKRNLAENSDLLQAEALVASRDLEVKQALTELDEAEVLFNALRHKTGNIAEKLSSLRELRSVTQEQSLDASNRIELAIFDEQMSASEKAIELEREKNKTSLDAFVSYAALSSREQLINTPSGFASPYQPNTTVGLRLNMPIDQELTDRNIQASTARKTATQLRKEEQAIQFKKELQTLLGKRKASLASLAVAERLEDLQRKKLKNEQKEYNNGRSTTYQILMFTQDLANAELAKLQAIFAIKIIDAQLRLFERNAS